MFFYAIFSFIAISHHSAGQLMYEKPKSLNGHTLPEEYSLLGNPLFFFKSYGVGKLLKTINHFVFTHAFPGK
jgi:hypothetical protein